MKKYIYITAALLMSNAAVKAQQLQSSSLYEVQSIIHNPAAAGIFENASTKATIGATYRSQWSGISGSPQTITAFGSFKLDKQKIGITGYVYNDKTGPTSRTGLDISLAKHIQFNDGGIFSLGIETRLLQYSLDRASLTDAIGTDPAIGTSDNRFKYDAGFGMAYSRNNFQIGAAVTQLVQSKLDYYKGNITRSEEARLYRHYYLHSRYTWAVDGNTTITPNILLTYLPNAPIELQGGARVTFNNLLWWGVGYKLRQSFMLSAGLNIKKKLSVGYSYDIYRTPISNFDGGSGAHEVLLSYNIF
ncbi:PorP/SprF family type IX secretion system membrane protein [Ferruginibacter yonginensis]|uniref:PorP/SprF family type IX secretion system membrane protein n=1 Tax=Ferruginibacter yonginensis TaxID=1310416 RepID=A0ABV8QUB9_9BACT